MSAASPSRGDIWLADLNPVHGHEQAGMRPVLVVSVDPFNSGKANLAVVIPITSTLGNIPFHVIIPPPEGGLSNPSAALCEGIRSISRDRLIKCWGSITPASLIQVEDRLRILLGLSISIRQMEGWFRFPISAIMRESNSPTWLDPANGSSFCVRLKKAAFGRFIPHAFWRGTGCDVCRRS